MHCWADPYALNQYTRGVSPLKCYEYLASGLHVISTRLPEVSRLATLNAHVDALDAAEMPSRVLALLAPPSDDEIARRKSGAATRAGTNAARSCGTC